MVDLRGIVTSIVTVLMMSVIAMTSLYYGTVLVAVLLPFVYLGIWITVKIYGWIQHINHLRKLDPKTALLIGEATLGLTLDGKEIIKKKY